MVTVHPLDDVWVRVECDDAIARELSDYFTFEAPGAHFMRRQQARFKHWDGRIRLFKLKTRTIYRGLVSRIAEFCAQRDYALEVLTKGSGDALSDEQLDAFLYSPGRFPFAPDPDQRLAVRTLLDTRRGIILSPTGSGKSFIIYTLAQLLDVKTLIVVPTIGLVSQMAADFASYGFDLKDLHTIQAGREKDADAKLYVSTWQSIFKLPPDYFAQFDCIIVDEVHQAKAKSLTHLLEKATSTQYRFGFTGTLDDTEAHRLILEGLFGSVTQVTTTRELQKRGRLADLRVKMVVLRYPEHECKQMKNAQYPDEVEFIVQHPARMAFVTKLVKGLHGNVLVLFNFVEKQGIPMHDCIKAACPDKDVHYIAGSVGGDERESIRNYVESENDNQVIVASYGTFSTGINLRNLRHLVFASPSKSKIRVLQSIGRALRTHETKDHATLWDLTDDLHVGKHRNFAMKHAEQRALYYASEKFPVSLHPISLDAFSQVSLQPKN